MFKWIHHLLNPHCEDCTAERLEKKVCGSCETLRLMLEQVQFEKKQLLDSLLETTRPVKEVVSSKEEIKPLTPRGIPWNTRRTMLENADREAAREAQRRREEMSREDKPKEDISELENEIGIIHKEQELAHGN